MEDKKRDAAEVGTICDTKPNETINIIAHELNKGKCAVYLRRDGWTMMPQLPTETGHYLQIRRGESGHLYYWPATWIAGGLLRDVEWVDRPQYQITIKAWQKLPDIPEWMKEEAEADA